MVIHLVDPAAYTPLYDHALAEALGEEGLDVTVYTSRYRYGPLPPPRRYRRQQLFYPTAEGRLRRLLAHPPAMARYLRNARAAVTHFQWLPVQPLDGAMIAAWRRRLPPLVLTAHDLLPREALPGQRRAQRLAYSLFSALVVHSRYGAEALVALGVEEERITVVPHGPLRPLPVPGEAVALPPSLSPRPAGPLALFVGILRPYKGIDLLLAAWREAQREAGLQEAELWLAGHPRVDASALARRLPPRTRLLARYLREGELLALLEAADLVVLPYLELESSGVAMLALGMEKPLLCSDAGSFPELAALGAARCVPAGNVPALAAALAELLQDDGARARLAAQAGAAGRGPLSWARAATLTAALYRRLAAGGGSV